MERNRCLNDRLSEDHQAIICLGFISKFVSRYDQDIDSPVERCSKDYKLKEFFIRIEKRIDKKDIDLQELIKYIASKTDDKRRPL